MSPSETDITFRGFGLGECVAPIELDFTINDLDLLNNPFSFSPPDATIEGDGRSCDDTHEVAQSAVSGAGPTTEADRNDLNTERSTSGTGNPAIETNADDTSSNPGGFQYCLITLHRGNIRRDMIDIFIDPSIMNCHIMVEMVNERVLQNKAEVQACFKDVLSLFWKEVYDSLMLGEGERVPFIRHDFQRKEWEAIARILLKG
ncbi:hypothetical protein OS493_035254 [Desmophyllum pertusum]|uniref:Uncharacterized protein n=1 Tax=Desmophyllum pertusum TaxID=174260 RepID=A0A9W9ZIK0_9CNID|nr:hypothetical protein OS493_035254 [Desmophyllum pertusum]